MQNFLNFIQGIASKVGTVLSQGVSIGSFQTTVGTVVATVVVTGTVATGGTVLVNEFNATTNEPTTIVETMDDTSDINSDNIIETTNPENGLDNVVENEEQEVPENVHVHSYTSNVIKTASCVETGTMEHVCECGYSYTNEIPLTSHTEGEWVVVEEATYDKEGLQTKSCTVCNTVVAREVISKVECNHNYKITASVEATCTQKGSHTYVCETCGSSYTDETDAVGHDYSKSKTVEATCTQKGAEYKICSSCGDEVQTSTIDMKPHNYIQNPDKENEEATCTKEGHNYYVCSSCGDEKVETTTKDHTWDEGKIEVEAECEKAGKKVFKCTECQTATKEEEIPALGHNWEETDRKESSCSEEGNIVYTCSICQSTKEEAINKKDHIWSDWSETTSPQCTAKGVETRTCTAENCGATETREIEALGHDLGEYIIDTPVTCEADGSQHKECSRCEYKTDAEKIPALGHSAGEWEVTKEASCTETGLKVKKCTTCSEILDTLDIAKLEHKFTVLTDSLDPTCTENGHVTYKCETCDNTKTTEVLALGHSAGEWEVTKEASCTETGLKVKKCTTCSETLNSETINKLPHKFTVLTDSLDPTCLEVGYTVNKCENCNQTERTELDALGHESSEWTTTKEASCTETGVAVKTCNRCNVELDSKTLDMIEHNYQLTESATPTCIAADDNIYNCSVCNKEKRESVPALGHTAGNEVVVEATDLKEGSIKQYCTTCGTTLKDEVIPKLPHTHNYETEIERQDATCTTDGFVKYQCRCEDIKTETLTKTGHTAGEWVETKAPTYTEKGMKVKNCVSCGVKVDEAELDVLPHTCNYTELISKTPATCTEKGMIVEACEICGERNETEINATGHNAGEWNITSAASCTTDGLKVQKCTTCSAEINSEVIPATGHSVGGWSVSSKAGCETTGTETRTCSNCSYSENKTIPAIGHDYGDWIVDEEPTEESEGSKHKECSRCDSVITEDIEQLPPHVHEYSESGRTESTCSSVGSITYTCSCGDNYSEEIAKLAHTEGDWSVTTGATCTSDGSKVKTCTSCGTTLKTESIPKVEHVYNVSEVKDATCLENGYTRYKCDSCESTYDTVISATGHSFGDAITEEATCTHTGSIKYVCGICRLENITETTALGHNYIVTSTVNPTCSEAGKVVYTCDRNGCEDSYEEELAMVEHKYNTKEVSATCETDGYTIKTCEGCGDEIIETNEGSATGHTAGEWVTILEPTYTEVGTKTKSCTVCNKILETEDIPVLELTNGDAVYTIELAGGETTTVIGHYDTELAAELMSLVNAYRVENKLTELTTTNYLVKCANKRGYQTSYLWDHKTPMGSSPTAAYDYAAENLAWYVTKTSALEIFNALKNCEDHNAIMLSNYSYNNTAVSVFCKKVGENDYEYYWVQIFD